MRFGWPISLFLHVVLFGASMLMFSRAIDIDSESHVIPIELTSISELTNIRATVKPRPVREAAPETPMTLETPMENSDNQGEAVVIDKPSEDSVPQVTPNETADPEITVEDQPTTPAFDLNKLAAIVDKTRESQPEVGQQQTLQSEENFLIYSEQAQAAVGAATGLSISEVDALKQKMYRCWRIPADAKNPKELIVTVRVRMRSDGNVSDVRLHEPGKVSRSSNPFMGVAARRAVNAVTNCGPYDFLPKEKYSSWQDMILRFIPEV